MDRIPEEERTASLLISGNLTPGDLETQVLNPATQEALALRPGHGAIPALAASDGRRGHEAKGEM